MAQIKTRENDASVREFLNGVKNETRRIDGLAVARMMQTASGRRPRMWGTSIVGFGKRRYTYANGKPGEMCRIGFAPRAQALVFYLGEFAGRSALLNRLGKHKVGPGGCLYVNKLADVDLEVLEEMFVRASGRERS